MGGCMRYGRDQGSGIRDRKVASAALGEKLGCCRGRSIAFSPMCWWMADDPAVRQARLALVQRIAALPVIYGIADLSQLQGF